MYLTRITCSCYASHCESLLSRTFLQIHKMSFSPHLSSLSPKNNVVLTNPTRPLWGKGGKEASLPLGVCTCYHTTSGTSGWRTNYYKSLHRMIVPPYLAWQYQHPSYNVIQIPNTLKTTCTTGWHRDKSLHTLSVV